MDLEPTIGRLIALAQATTRRRSSRRPPTTAELGEALRDLREPAQFSGTFDEFGQRFVACIDAQPPPLQERARSILGLPDHETGELPSEAYDARSKDLWGENAGSSITRPNNAYVLAQVLVDLLLSAERVDLGVGGFRLEAVEICLFLGGEWASPYRSRSLSQLREDARRLRNELGRRLHNRGRPDMIRWHFNLLCERSDMRVVTVPAPSTAPLVQAHVTDGSRSLTADDTVPQLHAPPGADTRLAVVPLTDSPVAGQSIRVTLHSAAAKRGEYAALLSWRGTNMRERICFEAIRHTHPLWSGRPGTFRTAPVTGPSTIERISPIWTDEFRCQWAWRHELEAATAGTLYSLQAGALEARSFPHDEFSDDKC